jgi:hypothetical protein
MAIGWFKKLNSTPVFQWPCSWSFSFFSSSPSPSGSSWRGLHLGFSLLDDLLFQILYCVEAVVLVLALCFFFLCCGCHIWAISWFYVMRVFLKALLVFEWRGLILWVLNLFVILFGWIFFTESETSLWFCQHFPELVQMLMTVCKKLSVHAVMMFVFN